ncbi:MAG: DUF721 domain-containing protein [Gammaproteobacteria bacterium]
MTHHVLKHENKSLQGLMGQLNELQELNALLTEHLDPEIAKHCQVVKFEKNCLFVIVDNGNWATQLRFNIPDVMARLRQTTKLKNISGIICKTRPNPHLTKSSKVKKRVVTGLSADAAKQILETAKTIKDDKIRKMLEKIASHSDS